MQYDFDRQVEIQKLEQHKKDLETNKELYRQKLFLTATSIGIFLMAAFLFMIYRTSIQRRKTNQLLQKQNTEILLQKEEISAQAEQLERTNFELEKLSIVARETDNAVAIFDSLMNIEWINEGYTRMYDLSFEELIARKGTNLIQASANTELANFLENILIEKKTITYETHVETPSKKYLWVQTTLTPITNSSGEIYKFIAIDTDISKLKNAEFEIKEKNKDLEIQKKQIEEQNFQIKSSIRYAHTIQNAMLPTQAEISKLFNNFILFLPKDIVSGDFYWFYNCDKYNFLVVADCTGHGVPGAFMSMIGYRLLDEIIRIKKICSTTQILENMNTGIINALKQKQTDNNDGMDICLCKFDKNAFNENNITVTFCGAKRPLYHYQCETKYLNIIKGSRRSLGGRHFQKGEFEETCFILKPNDVMYLTTDGYEDQSSPSRKKIGKTVVSKFLSDIAEESMEIQKQKLFEMLKNHQENEMQRDDITIIGIKTK